MRLVLSRNDIVVARLHRSRGEREGKACSHSNPQAELRQAHRQGYGNDWRPYGQRQDGTRGEGRVCMTGEFSSRRVC